MAGTYTGPGDVDNVAPVLRRIAAEYAAYDASGSEAWAGTLDVAQRPDWIKQLAPSSTAGATDQKVTAKIYKVCPATTID